jgi:hypothetical protein
MRGYSRLKGGLIAAGCFSLAAFGAACSCGGDDDPITPDGAVADAAEIDSSVDPPVLVRSGNIAVFEVEVANEVNPLIPSFSGAAVLMGFTDLTTVTVPPLDLDGDGRPDSNVNGCAVTVYDLTAGDTEPTSVDEGTFTFTGTGNGTFTCAYGPHPYDPNKKDGYTCQSTDASAAGAAPVGAVAEIIAAAPGQVQYKLPGANFEAVNYTGMWLVIDGFDKPAANGVFPILRTGNVANELVVFNLAMLQSGVTESAVVDNPGAYATYVGENPIPFGFTDFLDDGTANVNVSGGGDSAILDAIDVTFKANGAGFKLDNESEDITNVRTSGEAITFACNRTGGVCGPTAGGTLNAFVISGETTDGSLTNLSPIEMPEPVAKYATFTCSFIGQTSATIPAEAMAAILDTDPTRIQIRVANSAGLIVTNEAQTAVTNVLGGHAIVGFTDVTTR